MFMISLLLILILQKQYSELEIFQIVKIALQIGLQIIQRQFIFWEAVPPSTFVETYSFRLRNFFGHKFWRSWTILQLFNGQSTYWLAWNLQLSATTNTHTHTLHEDKGIQNNFCSSFCCFIFLYSFHVPSFIKNSVKNNITIWWI